MAAEVQGVPEVEVPGFGIPTRGLPGDQTTQAGPFRGMFYYPWYPEDWGACPDGINPTRSKYTPTRGCYSQDDPDLLREHVKDLVDAHVKVGISSWIRGTPTNPHIRDIRFGKLLDASRGTDLTWAPYYEREGSVTNPAENDPNFSIIQSDMRHIAQKYGAHPNYLKIDEKPVIFVFADSTDACGDGVPTKLTDPNANPDDPGNMVERWWQANRRLSRPNPSVQTPQFHVVLKVFDHTPGPPSDWENCTRPTPSGPVPMYPEFHTFHQYGPASPNDAIHRDSYVISPGFWHYADVDPPGGDQPFLERRTDSDWRARIQNMIGSGKFWQLITTYNEFAEGTQVEETKEFNPPDLYLRALKENGQEIFTVWGAGDIACEPGATPTASGCQQVATSNLFSVTDDAILTFGDDQYEDGQYGKFLGSFDQSWGKFFDIMHPSAGNHDYDDPNPSIYPQFTCVRTTEQEECANGYFDYFNGDDVTDPKAGNRGEGYYSFRLGNWLLISLNSECSDSGPGNPNCLTSPQYGWLRDLLAADNAPCTLAYWHHPRFSDGTVHGNDTRFDPFWQLLYADKADLILVGHDHNYQRFARLDPTGNLDPINGIRSFVVGTGGKNLTAVAPDNVPDGQGDQSEPEVWMGSNSPASERAFGALKLTLRPDRANWDFESASYTGAGTFDDFGTEVCKV